jgi:hypothetical protein
LRFPGRGGGEMYVWQPASWQPASEDRWTRRWVYRNAASTVWVQTSSYHKKFDSVRNVWELWTGFDPHRRASLNEQLQDPLTGDDDEEEVSNTIDPGAGQVTATDDGGEGGAQRDTAVVKWAVDDGGKERGVSNSGRQVTTLTGAGGVGRWPSGAQAPAFWTESDRQAIKPAVLAKALLASTVFSRMGENPLRVAGLVKQYANGGVRQRLWDRYVAGRGDQLRIVH